MVNFFVKINLKYFELYTARSRKTIRKSSNIKNKKAIMVRGSLVIERRHQTFVTSKRLGFKPCYNYNYYFLSSLANGDGSKICLPTFKENFTRFLNFTTIVHVYLAYYHCTPIQSEHLQSRIRIVFLHLTQKKEK